MGSKVLSQALIVMPQAHFPPKKLQQRSFSSAADTDLCHRFSTLKFSAFRVSSTSNFSLNPITEAKQSFTVRSEASADSSQGQTEEPVSEDIAEEAADASAPNSESESGTDIEAAAQPPRKPRVKLGDIMGILNKKAVEASESARPIPDIRTGDVVQIKLEVPENRRRLSIYKGIVISRQNAGIHTTIRVRRIIAGVGVEIVFPLYSPNIKEIKVVSHRKVRKARLYYLRDKLPRLSTFK